MVPFRSKLLALVSLIALSGALPALQTAQQEVSRVQAEAQRAFQSQDWEAAKSAFHRLSELQPSNGAAVFNEGYADYMLGQYEAGIACFKKAHGMGFQPSTCEYNLACGYSRLGKGEVALKWLHTSIENGFNNLELFQTDPDLAHIRGTEGYRRALYRLDPSAAPPPPDEVDTQALSTAGANAFRAGDWPAAAEAYGALSRAEPENGQAHFNYGFALYSLGRHDEGLSKFKTARELGFAPNVCEYNLACGFARLGQTEPALKWLELSLGNGFDRLEMLQTDTDLDSLRETAAFGHLLRKYAPQYAPAEAPVASAPDLKAIYASGREALEAGDWASAAKAFGHLSHLRPESGAAHYLHGVALAQLGEHEHGLEAMQTSLELGFDAPNAAVEVAAGYARLGRNEEAAHWLATSIEANPQRKEALLADPRFSGLQIKSNDWRSRSEPIVSHSRGDMEELLQSAHRAFVAEEWNQAVAGYRQVLELTPDHGGAHFNLGFALYSLGKHEAGLGHFQRAHRLGTAPTISEYNLACGYSRLGRSEEALAWLGKSLKNGFDRTEMLHTDPDLESLRSLKAFQRLAAEYAPQAEDAVALIPTEIDAAQVRQDAMSALNNGQWGKAAESFGLLQKLDPKDGDAIFLQGFALYKLNEIDAGIHCFERTLALGHRSEVSEYNLACGYSLKNDKEQALAWLARSLDHGFDNWQLLQTDPDLNSIRKEGAYKELLQRYLPE